MSKKFKWHPNLNTIDDVTRHCHDKLFLLYIDKEKVLKNLDRFYVALPVPGANPPCDAVWFRVALPANHTWMSWTVYYDSFFGVTRSLSAPRPYRQDLEFLKRQNPEWLISSLFSRAHYLSPIRDGISCIPTEPLFQRSASVSFHLPNYISKD